MKKTWTVIILLVIAVLGGYAWWQAQNAKLTADQTEPVMPASEQAGEAALDSVDAAEEDAAETETDAATAVTDAVTDAADAAAAAVETATDAAADAAGAASQTAGELASDAVDAATDAAEEAADAVTDAANAASDAITGAREAAPDAATTAPALTDLLTVDTFDPAQITAMIKASNLGATQKTALITAIDDAGENPEAIRAVIGQIKQAMGL